MQPPHDVASTESRAWKALLAAVAIWTAIAILILLVNPGGASVLLPCMKLVGRSAACEADQQSLNDAYWIRHTLPLVVAGLTGYAAIAALWLRRHRPR